MRIKFLGTGGGRYVTSYQLRRTGGFLLEDGFLLHVDPGPGAARALKDFGENVRKIDTLFVSHNHPDHVTDAPIVIEGMTWGTQKRKGLLIAPSSVLKGLDDYHVVSSYHQSLLERVEEVSAGDKVSRFYIIPAVHTEPKTVGFVFEGKRTVTYYSDTGYWKGMEAYAKDIVIFNVEVIKEAPTHTHPGVVKSVLERSSPRLIFFTHFGLSVLRFGPEKLGRLFEKEFGVDVVVAEDGMEWRKGKDVTLFDF